ncbi:MAG TPA: carboxypeptidase regulatory-like domain-containing protein [Candidatus Acidoferrales bacterium]|nr:carboxypeptidase regulatory-like domain-containing protein [Candidatus Acidoferrales bacterium]
MKSIRGRKWTSAAALLPILGLSGVVFFASGWTARRQAGGASGGEIAGRIHFQGEKPKLPSLDMRKDPVCISEHEGTVYAQDGAVNDNGTLPNAFVYIKSGTGKLPEAPPRNSVDLTQQGCMYEPHVLGIMVGQPLQVLTLDPTTHNIHVVGDANRDWNVTQQPGSPSVIRRFARPEVMIPVHCNEHPWMKAYIGVVSNPFFEVTSSDGGYALKGVPPGEYTIEVWTATFGTQEQKVTVREGETANLDFTFRNKQ